MKRRTFLTALGGMALAPRLPSAAASLTPEKVLCDWNGHMLELVRHTATYSPPVASRTFAYIGIAAYEAVASGNPKLKSLAGQVNGLTATPKRDEGQAYNDCVVVHSAMSLAIEKFFWNTGPTGQRAIKAITRKIHGDVSAGLDPAVVKRSEDHAKAVVEHIIAWSESDGGAKIENMGFPMEYNLEGKPESWVPTSTIAVQQKPLLPNWGNNRTFALPNGATCPLPPPPAYSEDKNSQFYKEGYEVYETVKNLTDEQKRIARFWSDDPMLSPTPPGHWMSIVLQIAQRDKLDLPTTVDAFARTGIALADGFIACWNAKYAYDLVRPVTYIKRVIDPKWEALLITPPFPEYPSGHSSQSGAAAEVLTKAFGENFAFADATHEREGIKPREFKNFWEAANEAGISRLYGGIHYRAAIERGLDQGRCIGAYVNGLTTKV